MADIKPQDLHSAAVSDSLLRELRAAHKLLALALGCMTAGGKARFAAESERLGLGIDGATRHHERAGVIAMASGEFGERKAPLREPEDPAGDEAAAVCTRATAGPAWRRR
jgi:hypothetical protein